MAAHVAVVGGGIAGLAAARALSARARSGHAPAGTTVTVVEAGGELGGKLRTSSIEGVPVDEGAEALLVRVPAGVDLARDVGYADDLVHPSNAGAAIVSRNAMRAIPGGTVLGIPTDLAGLARAALLSPTGLARVPLDLALPGAPLTTDVAVGDLVRRRMGREVVDRLVDPLLGGVYAGRADQLSLDAALPQLSQPVRRHRSLLLAARAARVGGAATARAGGPASQGPAFATLRGGLGRLPGAVAGAVVTAGGTIRRGSPVRELRRTPAGFRLVLGSTRDPEALDADAVVLAVPARPAARLLHTAAPAAAVDLGAIGYASMALVTLAWPAAAFPAPPSRSGFLVPATERRTVKAVTFSSVKWPHLAAAVPGLVLLRASVGRYGEETDLQRGDDELVAAVVADLAALTGVRGHPVASRVSRWGGGLPQYAVGHRDRVDRILGAVEAVPGLAVCGAAYDGVGVPACVASGQRAADRVLRHLSGGGQWGHG